jgi:hypothetical protein
MPALTKYQAPVLMNLKNQKYMTKATAILYNA